MYRSAEGAIYNPSPARGGILCPYANMKVLNKNSSRFIMRINIEFAMYSGASSQQVERERCLLGGL